MSETKVYVSEQFIKQQSETIAQLQARVARLEYALDYAGVKLVEFRSIRAYEYVDKILCETAPQSLAEIEAAAVVSVVDALLPNSKDEEYISSYDLIEYATNLREGK